MPEYNFGHNQGQDDTESTPESRKIPVEDGHISFNLGTAPGAFSTKSTSPDGQNKTLPNTPAAPPGPKSVAIKAKRSKFAYKIWHALEFVAVTAAVFMVLFIVLNFESYSQLFFTKLEGLRGQINQNPYTKQEAEQLKTASPEGQKPLPIVTNSQVAKRQFPELNLAIAPPDDRILIPRIGQNVPIIRVPTDMLIKRDWAALENQIQEALRYGVVHFPGTAYPGGKGNIVITGHSSYFPWDPGRFKDVFALLHQVEVGDKVVVYHEQKKYEYEVYEKKVVRPNQVEVLTQEGEDRLTLITCTPVGTDLNRLVLFARQVKVS